MHSDSDDSLLHLDHTYNDTCNSMVKVMEIPFDAAAAYRPRYTRSSLLHRRDDDDDDDDHQFTTKASAYVSAIKKTLCTM